MKEQSPSGIYVWALLDETPDIITHIGDVGLSLVGLFWTKEQAVNFLVHEVIGEERAEEINWRQSLHNPTYYEGYNEITGGFYILTREQVGNN